MLARTLVLKAAALAPVKKAITQSKALKGLRERFVGGDDLAAALAICDRILATGKWIALDQLGENVASLDEAAKATKEYLASVRSVGLREDTHKFYASVKLTQMGLDQSDDVAETNLRKLVEEAAKHETFIRVDMEGSAYTERTLTLVERVHADTPNVGTVLQSYLHRNDDDVARMIERGISIRIVKGAYLEPPEIAYQDKDRVDEGYVRSAERLLQGPARTALATHDHTIIAELRRFVKEKGISTDTYEWQMLYGIRDSLQGELVAEGETMRVYLPYGPSWYPYFTRRLAERPANLLFFARALGRG